MGCTAFAVRPLSPVIGRAPVTWGVVAIYPRSFPEQDSHTAIYYRSCCSVCDPPTFGRRPNLSGSPRICPNLPDPFRASNFRTLTEPFTPVPPIYAHFRRGSIPQVGGSPPPLVPLPLGLILLGEDVVLLVFEAGSGRFVDNDGRVRVELQNARGARRTHRPLCQR